MPPQHLGQRMILYHNYFENFEILNILKNVKQK